MLSWVKMSEADPTTGNAERPPRLRRWGRFGLQVLAWLAVLTVVPGLVWLTVGSRMAARREAELGSALQAAAGGGELPSFARLPSAVDPSAARLAELVEGVGIRLLPRPAADAAAPAAEAPAADPARFAELTAYLFAQLGREDGGLDRPPAAVAAFLGEHQDALRAVCHHIVEAGPPHWAERASLFDRAELDPVGYRWLQRLVMVDALAASEAGAPERAEESLVASWSLNQGLLEVAEPGAVLQALEVTAVHAAALRAVDVNQQPWLDRLQSVDVRGAARRALVADAWLWVEAVRSGQAWDEVAMAGPGARFEPIARPWLRMGMVERGWAALAALDELEASVMGETDLEVLEQMRRDGLAGWNLVGRLTWTSLAPVVVEAAETALELELTAQVLEARRHRSATGEWPETPAAPESRAVPGLRWTYAVAGGNGPTVVLAGAGASLNLSAGLGRERAGR